MYQPGQPQYVNPGMGDPKTPNPYGQPPPGQYVQPGQMGYPTHDPGYMIAQPIQPNMGPPPGGYMVETYAYQQNYGGQFNAGGNHNNGANNQLMCNGQTSSISIHCPSCNKRSMTRTKCQIGQKQWCFAFIWCFLLLLGCPTICICFPCYIPSCYEYKHYCSDCGTYVGASNTGDMNQQHY